MNRKLKVRTRWCAIRFELTDLLPQLLATSCLPVRLNDQMYFSIFRVRRQYRPDRAEKNLMTRIIDALLQRRTEFQSAIGFDDITRRIGNRESCGRHRFHTRELVVATTVNAALGRVEHHPPQGERVARIQSRQLHCQQNSVTRPRQIRVPIGIGTVCKPLSAFHVRVSRCGAAKKQAKRRGYCNYRFHVIPPFTGIPKV